MYDHMQCMMVPVSVSTEVRGSYLKEESADLKKSVMDREGQKESPTDVHYCVVCNLTLQP